MRFAAMQSAASGMASCACDAFLARLKFRKATPMKLLIKSAMLASVAGLGLALAACDSPAENAAEDQADTVRDAAEATADAIENKADAMDTTANGVDSASENAMENKADAVRASGEAKADAMEEQADKADKSPG